MLSNNFSHLLAALRHDRKREKIMGHEKGKESLTPMSGQVPYQLSLGWCRTRVKEASFRSKENKLYWREFSDRSINRITTYGFGGGGVSQSNPHLVKMRQYYMQLLSLNSSYTNEDNPNWLIFGPDQRLPLQGIGLVVVTTVISC